MKHVKYSMSFTTGTLFHRESVNLAGLYLDLSDWNSVRDKVIAENLLQTRTLNTLKRVCREIISRLKTLRPNELEYLVANTPDEQACLLWLAVCRRYLFVADFAIEVLHERFITLKTDLPKEEFDTFFNRKAEWHSELDHITESTRRKLSQVLFKILRETGLITADNQINAVSITPGVMELLESSDRREILYFPMTESDLTRIAP
jgi:hypothetical protein